MRNNKLVTGVMIASVCVGGPALFAQSAASSGQIVGTVVDPSAAAVAGAQVTVRNTKTNFTRHTKSDSEGRYAVSDLPLGAYIANVTVSGFQTASASVYVSLGSSVSIHFDLSLEGDAESVNVTAGNP